MHRNFSVIAAFTATSIVIAVPYWQIPYSQIALPNSLFGAGILLALALSAALRLDRSLGLAINIVACAAAFPAMVLLRIVYDVAIDSSSHNLWPFELIISAVLGLVVSLAGIAVGSMVRVLLFGSQSERKD